MTTDQHMMAHDKRATCHASLLSHELHPVPQSSCIVVVMAEWRSMHLVSMLHKRSSDSNVAQKNLACLIRKES